MTELAAWYQKKIGTYDKQEWETTIEQRILQGLHNVPLKSAKLKPDLIDVDLIRGSSFPKAKPVQGLATVVRLALLRVFLFPFWKHWWAIHTSPPATRAFFSLWILQVVNTILFLIAPSSSNIDSSCILVPLSLMAGLGIVHAFIVSTAHPHLNNIRCRGHERRRPCLLTSGTQDGEIFRKANVQPNEIFHSTDISNVKEFVSVVSKSTQTQITGNDVEINSKKWSEGFLIPKVSLTPPAHQSVKFNLSSISLKNRETSGEDDDSPVLRQRQRNINPRVARISAEGDDGFESLNGNNSNGSENGDDIVKFEDQIDNQPTQKHNIAIESPANEDNPDLILFEDKITKRLNAKDSIHKETKYWNKDGKEDESVINGNTVKFKCDTQVCSDGGSSTNLSGDNGHCETNDRFRSNWFKFIEKSGSRSEGRCRKSRKDRESNITSSSDEECDTASASLGVPSQHADFAQTTNSEECSYCSEPDESESEGLEGDSAWEPFAILNPASERVSCTVWENGRVRKAQMSVMDISEAVVKRADQVLNRNDSALWPGIIIATTLATLLPATRLLQILIEIGNDQVTVWDLPYVFLTNSPFQLVYNAFGANIWECVINFFSALLRLGLGSVVFFLLAVAQRAFNQRFLYAKLFSHLTSARRARQSTLPHFRLNRVRNIKTWLSVRSYLMRRGPQRSVDIIVSSAFILLVLLISFLVIDLLQDQSQGDLSRTAETLGWAVALGAVLLRLVALGTRASRKHRCLPVLLTEQINLYLAMERRPASKDRLSVANNVLKLAADLLKELESPFKISGLSANPYLYTITKVVVLSALSGVLSDLLGFKLKLHKIKIK